MNLSCCVVVASSLFGPLSVSACSELARAVLSSSRPRPSCVLLAGSWSRCRSRASASASPLVEAMEPCFSLRRAATSQIVDSCIDSPSEQDVLGNCSCAPCCYCSCSASFSTNRSVWCELCVQLLVALESRDSSGTDGITSQGGPRPLPSQQGITITLIRQVDEEII